MLRLQPISAAWQVCRDGGKCHSLYAPGSVATLSSQGITQETLAMDWIPHSLGPVRGGYPLGW